MANQQPPSVAKLHRDLVDSSTASVELDCLRFREYPKPVGPVVPLGSRENLVQHREFTTVLTANVAIAAADAVADICSHYIVLIAWLDPVGLAPLANRPIALVRHLVPRPRLL